MINKALSRFMGRRFIFKYRFPYSGIFRGIHQHNGQYGMIFTNIKTLYDNVPVTIAMIVHPRQTKCVAMDNFVQLRAACRAIFDTHNWHGMFDMIYIPKHRVLNTKVGSMRGEV